MVVRRTLTDEDRRRFPVGQAIRYLPGFGTYGFEDCLEDDGRLPGKVIGHTPTRVRVELTLTKRSGITVNRAVNADQLLCVLTPAEKKSQVLAQVAEMLDDPTCQIEWRRGKRETTEPGDMNRQFEPSGKELRIKVGLP